MIEEKTEPLQNLIEQLQIKNMNPRKDLYELEQYGRRLLIRLSAIPESSSEDTKAKILKKKKTSKSTNYVFYAVSNYSRKTSKTKGISVSEDLSKNRDSLVSMQAVLSSRQKKALKRRDIHTHPFSVYNSQWRFCINCFPTTSY